MYSVTFPHRLHVQYFFLIHFTLLFCSVWLTAVRDIETFYQILNVWGVFSGWFQKILNSRVSLQAQHEQERKAQKSSSSSTFCSSSPSQAVIASTSLRSQSALSSPLRWSRKYDVFVSHSSVDSDSEEAGRLVSFLEASPHDLRCFQLHRDDCPGGPTSTELCQAVQNSHTWALLITPNFMQDDWCCYMMHQALAEGAMSNRIIPLVLKLSRSQYPQELKFVSCIDLSHNPDQGYTRLNNTVLMCE